MNKTELKYLLLIFIIFISACIETDIYLPAFPDMMAYFSVSETEIQRLLTWNFFGICVSGPFYGPISDSYGRKKPLVTALGLFSIGSLITVIAETFDFMLFGRLLQGLGSGGCFTLGIAILFDTFQKEKAIYALNQLNLSIPLTMAMAPMIGGYLNNLFNFRSNFLAIAMFVFVSLILCLFFFKEPLIKEKREPLRPKKLLRDFRQVMTSASFWQLNIIMCLMFAGFLSFLSGASVLFVIEFGISKQLSPFYQAAILGGWVAGSLTCSRAIMKWGNFKIKIAGLTLMLIGGIWLAVTSWLAPKNPELLTISMMIYSVGGNWIMGLYFPESMEIFPNIKGITASLMTSLRLLLTASIIAATSYFYDATIYPLTIAISGILAIILPTIILYERKKMSNNLEKEPPFALNSQSVMH